jgi:hypothetical protein
MPDAPRGRNEVVTWRLAALNSVEAARPSFVKAHADPLAHFAAADAYRQR